MFRKNYVGLIFSSQIEEYVGAKGNTLEDDSAASVQLQESKDLFLLPMDLVDELNEAVQMFGGSALV